MSYDDFCRCTPSQYQEVIAARRRWEEGQEHSRWESLRWASCATIQPHIRGKADPKAIMPLPWDDAPNRPKVESSVQLTKEAQKGRFESLMSRTKKN